MLVRMVGVEPDLITINSRVPDRQATFTYFIFPYLTYILYHIFWILSSIFFRFPCLSRQGNPRTNFQVHQPYCQVHLQDDKPCKPFCKTCEVLRELSVRALQVSLHSPYLRVLCGFLRLSFRSFSLLLPTFLYFMYLLYHTLNDLSRGF